MLLDEKYEQFRDEYFTTVAPLVAFFNNNEIGKLLMSPNAPRSKKEWLESELKEATENENYQYCAELKTELDGL